MKRILAASLTAAAFGFASAAQAAPAAAPSPVMADAHCLLAMVALTHSSDPNAQRMGQGGAIFFAGRIQGREPGFDFTRLKSIAASMDMKTVQADLQQHCGPLFTQSVQKLDTALAPPAGAAAAPPSAPPLPPSAHH